MSDQYIFCDMIQDHEYPEGRHVFIYILIVDDNAS